MNSPSLWCGLFAIFFGFNSASVIRNKRSESDLVSVVVLFRHGDKTPTTSFKNDPYNVEEYWPMGFGQLTKRGKLRHYELGRWLRRRYDAFLPTEYNVKDIYVRSTDVDRTLMSAAANLAGLYPPTDSQMWNEDLPWQPIPVHTMPKEDDQILYVKNIKCDKYERLYDAVYAGDYFQKINQENADFYNEVSKLTDWNVTDVHYFAQLQSILYVYSNYNSSYLPSWASSIDQDKLEYLSGLNYARFTFTPEMKRLRTGPFFDYVLSHLDKVVANSTAPKFLMLSSHETNVASALNTMEVFDNKAPAFASCIIWELRKTGDDYFINMFYKKNSSVEVPDQLQLKNCDFDCDYGSYRDILDPIRVNVTEWKKECLDIDS